MKQIQPVTAWSNGQQLQANRLNMCSINDNLSTGALFNYQILSAVTDEEGNVTSATTVAEGTLSMGGADYIAWGEATDINEAAYVWGAQQLNLTLV